MLKKTFFCVLCVILMLAGQALGEKAPSDQVFDRAKAAVQLLNQNDMDGALEKLSFSYATPGDSDEAFKSFITWHFPDITSTTVQTDVAVFYWENLSAHYLLAIPLTEPVNGDVMCIVLLSPDLEYFDGYAALTWSEVTDGTSQSEWVWWNVEYAQSTGSLYPDS